MRNYSAISEVTEEYLRKPPEEIDSFVSVVFEEYAQDGDIAALHSSLRVVSCVKGEDVDTLPSCVIKDSGLNL
jgi:hypothetical protein